MNLTKIKTSAQLRIRAAMWFPELSPELSTDERTPLYVMWAHWSPAQRRAWSHGVSLRVMFA